jgi:Sulfotransferase family
MPSDGGHGGRRAPVVGIIGSGRSGSTLLEFLLAGHLADARSLGELETLVVRGPRDDEPCTCGLPASECPQWEDVIRRLAAHPLRQHWDTGVEDHRYRLRWGTALYARAVRRRVVGRLRADERGSWPSGYAPFYVPVLDVLAELSVRPAVLIDNSKTPMHFFALAAVGVSDLCVIHLIRRPEAVVWSWRQRKPLPESGSKNWFLELKSPLRSCREWLFDNLLAASLPKIYPNIPYVRISYEDLCRKPEEALARCVGVLSLNTGHMPERRTGYHSIGGNPARFTGFQSIEVDDAWRTNLRWPVRFMLLMIAVPVYRLLLRKRRTA